MVGKALKSLTCGNNKGQKNCCKLFLESIKNGTAAPIDASEIFEVASISIDIAKQLRAQ